MTMYRTRSEAILAENEAMDSIARINRAIDLIRSLRVAVAPFSATAAARLREIEAVLEVERQAAINRRVQAAKEI